MIFLIANKNDSARFDGITQYFKLVKFSSFAEASQQLKSGLNKKNNLPLTIIAEETVGNETVYEFLFNPEVRQALINVPKLIIKYELTGFEHENVKNNIVDDYIDYNCNIVDLIERIRFFLMYKNGVSFPQFNLARNIPILSFSFLLKRAFDICFAVTTLLILLPFLVLIALIIKLESKGPVFYISPRAGMGYKIFKFIKFRTMVTDADNLLKDFMSLNKYNRNDKNSSIFVKLNRDPRITRFGYFLRRTSLDELPQLINVILGDMSIVGNRPLPLYEACNLTVDNFARRFYAPAGITGLWQVSKKDKPEMSTTERIFLDIFYAENNSPMFDLKIMFRTLSAMTQNEAR